MTGNPEKLSPDKRAYSIKKERTFCNDVLPFSYLLIVRYQFTDTFVTESFAFTIYRPAGTESDTLR